MSNTEPFDPNQPIHPQPTPIPITEVDVVPDPTKPWKALVPVALGILYLVWQAVEAGLGDDNNWSQQDTLTVVGALITALLVYFVPNPQVVKR